MNLDRQPGFGPEHFGRGGFGPVMFDDHHDGATWHWIVPLLFLLVLIAMFAWMLLQSRRRPATGSVAPAGAAAADPALEELRLRYARGEVGRDEFVTTEADLRGRAPVPRPPEPPAPPPVAA